MQIILPPTLRSLIAISFIKQLPPKRVPISMLSAPSTPLFRKNWIIAKYCASLSPKSPQCLPIICLSIRAIHSKARLKSEYSTIENNFCNISQSFNSSWECLIMSLCDFLLSDCGVILFVCLDLLLASIVFKESKGDFCQIATPGVYQDTNSRLTKFPPWRFNISFNAPLTLWSSCSSAIEYVLSKITSDWGPRAGKIISNSAITSSNKCEASKKATLTESYLFTISFNAILLSPFLALIKSATPAFWKLAKAIL